MKDQQVSFDIYCMAYSIFRNVKKERKKKKTFFEALRIEEEWY